MDYTQIDPRPTIQSKTRKQFLCTSATIALKAAGLSAGLLVSPAYSATITWSGGSSDDWFIASNWNNNIIPKVGDGIRIGSTTPDGAASNGTAAIRSGGSAVGSTLTLGYNIGTSGHLTVMSGASLNVQTLNVGRQGTGTLAITGGTVNVSSTFAVGGYSSENAGSGNLQITEGGILNKTNSGYTYIGYRADTPPSTILIDGLGSIWNTDGGVILGGNGNGSGEITVQNGGQLKLSNTTKSNTNLGLGLADGRGSTGTLTIKGSGSKVTTTPGIMVGITGKAFMSILDGATLESSSDESDYDYIGYMDSSRPCTNNHCAEGHVVVDGQGSSWINHTALLVGYTGIGTMTISNGASVISTYGSLIGFSTITGAPEAAHGEVLISGPGSIWSTKTLDMALFNGATAVLTVADGAILRTTDAAGIRSVGNGGQGIINIGATQGESPVAPGVLDTQTLNLGAQGTLVFNHSKADYSFTPTIGSVEAGNGTVNQLAGTTILTGNSDEFTGTTHVMGGVLRVDGSLGAAVSTVLVDSGSTLGGGGAIGGTVMIADDGNLAPNAGGAAGASTLTIGGNLVLNEGSILNYNFGQSNTAGGTLNDLTVVHGNLTLDGMLNVVVPSAGSFDPGVYRVISYNGMLTDNSLTLGSLPAMGFEVQTSVDGQVNLVSMASQLPLTFWNGGTTNLHGSSVVNGGNGVWQSLGGNTNWTDQYGTLIGPWNSGNFAVFMAAPGMVTVDGSLGAVSAAGMQFASDGYVVQGDDITLINPQSMIRVGDGSSIGAEYTATIAANLIGDSQLVKNDLGTLVLGGANSYSGGTMINGGTLRISADNNLGTMPGSLLFDGGTLNTTASFTTARDTTLNAGGGTFAIDPGTTLALSGMINGAGGLTKTGIGTLILEGNASRYSGGTTVMAGTLQAAAANTLSPNSVVTVAGSGTLDLAGFNQYLTGLSNAGLVNLGTGIPPGTILTINGDYAGNTGGMIMLNTFLGDDNAPTDRMIVNGGTSGTSLVKVINANGPGGRTVEGIRIIDIAGTSDGIFTLQGDYETLDDKPAIVAGAYAYTLEKNGISTPADGGWYLRSASMGDPAKPRYQPGIPVYEAYPQALLGLNGVSTLQQRIGNRVWSGNGNKAAEGIAVIGISNVVPQKVKHAIEGNGVWGRIEGTHHQVKTGRSTSGVDYDQDVFKLQAGVDSMLMENENGKLIGGIAMHYAHGLAKTTSIHDAKTGGGRINTDGYGFSGTLTRHGDNGFYLDGQAQVTWYHSDLNYAAGKSLISGNRGFGYALSLESGKLITLDPAWSLTPQAQLTYSQVKFNDFHGGHGTAVSLGKGDSLQGRLGLTLDYENSWRNDRGTLNRAHVYGIMNVYYEFLDGTRVDVADVSFGNRKDRLWGGIGLGGSYNWNDDKYSIYGEGLVNTSLSHFANSYSLTGIVGFRMRW